MRKIPTKLDLFDRVNKLVDVAAIAYFALLDDNFIQQLTVAGAELGWTREELLEIRGEIEKFFEFKTGNTTEII